VQTSVLSGQKRASEKNDQGGDSEEFRIVLPPSLSFQLRHPQLTPSLLFRTPKTHDQQASRASSELDEAYASVHSWIDEVRKRGQKRRGMIKGRH